MNKRAGSGSIFHGRSHSRIASVGDYLLITSQFATHHLSPIASVGDMNLDSNNGSEVAISRRSHGMQGRSDHRGKGRINAHEGDDWQKKFPIVHYPNNVSAPQGGTSFTLSMQTTIQCWLLTSLERITRISLHQNLQSNAPESVISGCSMQHGILANAFHAISTGTMFTVYYHPWTCPSEFLVPFNEYIKSSEMDFSVGARFRLKLDGEECPEKRRVCQSLILAHPLYTILLVNAHF